MNKFNFKSLVAVLLTVMMVFSILPVTVSAAETTTDKKYTFADYAKGEQYAMEEVHVLDNVITVTTSDAHFREELRMYDSEGPTGHNSIAVITSTNVIRSVVLNVGNNVATLNVYGSTDGATWTLVEGVAVVKDYADYTVNMPDGVDYTSLKLDVEGLKQLRVKYMTLTLVGAFTPDTPDVPETPVVPATLAEQIAAAKALANKEYLPYDSTITGTITDAPQASSYTEGQYKFTVSDGTNTLLCYFVPVTGGTPENGDTVTVTGKLTAYNGSAQFDSTAAATITKKGEVETPENPETPTDTVVTAPKAGVAYKFGMVQGNLNNKIYYLKGGMNGYYLDTTDDVASAIDVFLEETDGGYYLYTMVDGVKTYINMVVSGTHVNGAYEATASTVYTWDAEHGTLISVVDGKDYWFGTRNDKNYTTVGPCATSYNGFYCQFYPSDTVVEPAPTGDVMIVVVAGVLLAGAALALISRKRRFN